MGKVICTLDKDINRCPHYRSDDLSCANEKPCSFGQIGGDETKISGEYVREERWYEKYYKKQ